MNRILIRLFAVSIFLWASVMLMVSSSNNSPESSFPNKINTSPQEPRIPLEQVQLIEHLNNSENLVQVLPSPTVGPDQLMIFTVHPQNNSGEGGVVILEEVGGRTKVTIDLLGGPAEVAQRAEIRFGTCLENGAAMQALNSAVDGYSETILNMTIADLGKNLPLSVGIRSTEQSESEGVACGNLDFTLDNVDNGTRASDLI